MKTLTKFLFVAVALLAFSSCNKENDEIVDGDGTVITAGHTGGATCSPRYVTTPAEGKLDNKLLKILSVTASTNYFDDTEYRITFNDAVLLTGSCSVGSEGTKRSATLTVKKVVGTYNLSDSKSVSFSTVKVGSTIVDVVSCGQIEILSISADEVTGRIHAIGDETQLNGTFTAQICK